MDKKTLLLIDANSIVHRAYHALPNLKTSKGVYTGAIYGFLTIFLRIVKELSPTHVAAAFDLKAPTFRHKLYAPYKGTRKPMDAELAEQFEPLKELLKLMRVPVVSKEGYEADDILGTLSVVSDEDTVILTGHYDVVDVEEYGSLKEYAFDLDEINARIQELPMDDDSRKDLASGEWIFGRGTADMKFGHALCIELMRHFDEEARKAAESGAEPPLKGNLLYVAVCGEETNSEGMLQAVSFLNDFAREKGVHYKAFLLTECFMSDDPSRDTSKYIHYGASGKVMPMFFFAGEACHAAEPFMGIDPDLMACEVYRRMHLNPEFCQTSMGEITPPPVCLSFRDMKPTYSVSTPLYTASYYNLITVKLNPEEVMEKLLRIAREAVEASKDFVRAKAAEYEKATGANPVVYSPETCVLTFRELYEQACADFYGGKEALDARIRELADGRSLPS